MSTITKVFEAEQQGEARAIDELFALVYEELCTLAAAKMPKVRFDREDDEDLLLHMAEVPPSNLYSSPSARLNGGLSPCLERECQARSAHTGH